MTVFSHIKADRCYSFMAAILSCGSHETSLAIDDQNKDKRAVDFAAFCAIPRGSIGGYCRSPRYLF